MSRNGNILQDLISESTLSESKIQDLKKEGSAPIKAGKNQTETKGADKKLSKRKAKQMRRALAAEKSADESERQILAEPNTAEVIEESLEEIGTDAGKKEEEEPAEIEYEKERIDVVEESVVPQTEAKIERQKDEDGELEANIVTKNITETDAAEETQSAVVISSEDNRAPPTDTLLKDDTEKQSAVKSDKQIENVADKLVATEIQSALDDFNQVKPDDHVVDASLKEEQVCAASEKEKEPAPLVLPEVVSAPVASAKTEGLDTISSGMPTMTVDEKATKCACIIL